MTPDTSLQRLPAAPPIAGRGRFIRRTRSVGETDPSALFHCMAGVARGFWGRGGEWVAWGGVLQDLQLPGGAAPNGGASRFESASALLAEASGEGHDFWRTLPHDERPIAFGGFGFLDDEAGSGAWDGFGVGRFIVPRVLLVNDANGARLVAQGFSHREAELEALLDRTEASLIPLRRRSPGIPPDPRAVLQANDGSRDRWEAGVEEVLRALTEGRVAKVVLARTRDVSLPGEVRLSRVLRFLRHENRMAHVYFMELEAGRTLLGAAPEVLASLRGGVFEATAVAGSVPRGGDDAQDRALARKLLESRKDREEHRLTAEEMVEVLEPRLSSMEVEVDPHVLTLARIQHLETRIRGNPGAGEDILSLVEALHPTPAVCGRPRKAALELIRKAEPFDRGWYAGPVGWFDGAGDGEFVPALRSAVGGGREWRLFAGAGIVPGSDPASEWEETALKFEPALRALAAGMED